MDSNNSLVDKSLLSAKEEQEIIDKIAKKKILVACLLALTIGNMMVYNVIAVLPNFINKTEWDGLGDLNESDISLILAIFSIA